MYDWQNNGLMRARSFQPMQADERWGNTCFMCSCGINRVVLWMRHIVKLRKREKNANDQRKCTAFGPIRVHIHWAARSKYDHEIHWSSRAVRYTLGYWFMVWICVAHSKAHCARRQSHLWKVSSDVVVIRTSTRLRLMIYESHFIRFCDSVFHFRCDVSFGLLLHGRTREFIGYYLQIEAQQIWITQLITMTHTIKLERRQTPLPRLHWRLFSSGERCFIRLCRFRPKNAANSSQLVTARLDRTVCHLSLSAQNSTK